ncbi:hypothetical protein KP78_16940 [Jeotgalibacillus soli]|uniref:Uncharacterized protein n=1 Tax=Jeotgalibacillus soli TaxID=889306 RepID=A0A0C2VH97_9BACL|nr:hypothetical protein KP78_16940 [Jeotgalibacillus soli]
MINALMYSKYSVWLAGISLAKVVKKFVFYYLIPMHGILTWVQIKM